MVSLIHGSIMHEPGRVCMKRWVIVCVFGAVKKGRVAWGKLEFITYDEYLSGDGLGMSNGWEQRGFGVR